MVASLLATEQVHLGDMISVNWNGSENGLMFLKEAEGEAMPLDPSTHMEASAVAASSGGRHVIAEVTKLIVAAEELYAKRSKTKVAKGSKVMPTTRRVGRPRRGEEAAAA